MKIDNFVVRDLEISFTGSRTGMTDQQKLAVDEKLVGKPSQVNHGDCIGADAEFHQIMYKKWEDNLRIDTFPGHIERYRAFCQPARVHRSRNTLERNRLIVMLAEVLVTTPKSEQEKISSGTWYTMEYAQERNVPIVVVWPNGRIEKW